MQHYVKGKLKGIYASLQDIISRISIRVFSLAFTYYQESTLVEKIVAGPVAGIHTTANTYSHLI